MSVASEKNKINLTKSISWCEDTQHEIKPSGLISWSEQEEWQQDGMRTSFSAETQRWG
jgi:hypothetical protein